MKINLNNGITERERKVQTGKTFISPNLIREREMLDRHGNVIDPKTKQIIRRANEEE